MEIRMETTIVYWGCIGIMEKKMETTIMGYIGVLNKGQGKLAESVAALAPAPSALLLCWGYIGIMEKKMETTI